MDYVIQLWETKRWLFWLLLPVMLIIIGLQFFLNYKSNKVATAVPEATKQDEALKAKETVLVVKEAVVEEKLAAKAETIAERKVEEIPLDWNKTFKPEGG